MKPSNVEREPTTRVARVFDQIFQLLVNGELTLGSTINEVALAERFSVSRGPVREAIMKLQGHGLIVKEPYCRARVVELTTANMIEIFQLREAVEGMAVRLAVANMPDDEIDALLEDYELARQNGCPAAYDMHVAIARGSGNERIRTLLCDELYYLVRLYRQRSGETPGRREDARIEHWQILRALRLRDADLAESLMRAHIGGAARSLQDLLARQTAQESPAPKMLINGGQPR